MNEEQPRSFIDYINQRHEEDIKLMKQREEAYKRGYNDALDEMIREIARQVEAGHSFEEIARSIKAAHSPEELEGKEEIAEKLKEFYQGKYL